MITRLYELAVLIAADDAPDHIVHRRAVYVLATSEHLARRQLFDNLLDRVVPTGHHVDQLYVMWARTPQELEELNGYFIQDPDSPMLIWVPNDCPF